MSDEVQVQAKPRREVVCNDPACGHPVSFHDGVLGCSAELERGDWCSCGRSPVEVVRAAVPRG